MNVKEGVRRLALLFGMAGAILGGFASYSKLQTVLDQRYRHNRFEQLANLDVVRQARPSGPVPTDDQWKVIAVKVDRDGIKTIHLTKDYAVESIETQDGQTLYPTPQPSLWLYIQVALLPILGFVIPWGAIHAFRWVTVGFLQMPN